MSETLENLQTPAARPSGEEPASVFHPQLAERIDPNRDAGTVVRETDANGTPKGPGLFSVAWTTRLRPNGTAGCPQWIDMIVVGDTLAAAQKGKALIPADNKLASSSMSSHDVLVIHVDQSGSRDNAFVVQNLVAGKLADQRSQDGYPIALEFWHSAQPFAPGVLQPIEQKCDK